MRAEELADFRGQPMKQRAPYSRALKHSARQASKLDDAKQIAEWDLDRKEQGHDSTVE